MHADKKLKVPTLDQVQAWSLFRKHVGQEIIDSDQEIREIAEEVVGKCDGLPFALITIGSAMSSKKMIHEWEHARTTHRKHADEFEGIKALFSSLKSSYDALGNDTLKHCFLYCSLYPNGDSIFMQDLVQAWIAEGYLDKYQDMDAAMNKGIDIIGALKSAFLLENRLGKCLSMHNIVRQLALWVARENGNKWFVEEYVEANQSLDVDIWKSAERVCIKSSSIIRLPHAPKCPRLLTLRFLTSSNLLTISSGIFLNMPILRVLYLTGSGIKKFQKVSATCFSCSLLLCHILESESVGNLTNLRSLDLRDNSSLYVIPLEKISRLPRLQMLNLSFTGVFMISEDLERLKHLKDLEVTVNEMETLDSILHSHRLKFSVRHLSLFRCEGLTGLAHLLGIMKKLECLKVECCLQLEDMCLPSTLEILRLYSLPKLNIMWIKRATEFPFKIFWFVAIANCDLLKDISWILLAPNLTYRYIHACPEVERVGTGEVPRSVVYKKSATRRVLEKTIIVTPKFS